MDVKLHKSNNESTIKKMDQESSNKASQKNLSSLLMRLLSSDKTDQQQQQIERDQSLTDNNEEEYDEDQEDEENEEDDENEDDDNEEDEEEEDEEEDEQDYLEDLELDNNRSRSSTHRKTSTTTTSTSIISAKSTTTTKNDTNNSRNKRQLNNKNNNNEEEDDFEEEIELQPKTANSIKENTRNEKGEQQVAVAAVSLRQKKGGQKRSNELDSIRFSMYNIQNSQINEIDALLNELNQLQDTLENEEDENNEPNSITIKQQQMQNVGGHFEPPQQQKQHLLIMEKPSTMLSNQQNFYHHQQSDIEAIDQQFDEVLKFLAQTIDETTTTTATSQQTNPTESSSSATGSGTNGSSASPSSASLSATPNSHSDSHSDNGLSTSSAKSSPVNNLLDRSSNGAGSSNSSGIGDDLGPNPATTTTISAHIFTPSNGTTNNNTTTTTLSAMALQYRADVMGSKPHQPQSILKTTAVNKRNSSDSAFMETVSMPSSVSLGVLNRAQNMSHSNASTQNLLPKSETDFKQTQAEAQKAELIRIALEKLREANIKKLIVKAYTDDGCAKSVIIDETMKIYDVMLMLFSKNHTKPTVNYSIVEYLPKFHMERIFEDHEHLVEAMSNWTRDSDNQILFTERADKYDLFLKPELYLMNEKTLKKIDESDRSRLVTEFFQNIGSPVPEIEGPLYLKIDSKKSWKKHYCVLRQSGLYFIPKGKSKKDLQCLFSFDKLDLYYGIDWRRELKAPTDSCFALKYPQVQKKSSKYIKYVCCENQRDLKRWFNGIRIAKFGKQLHENYKRMLELIEMNRLSGRLPVASTRRLSASISSNSQRPHSSYSLNVNSTSSGTSSSQQPTDEAAPTSPSGQQQNSGYFDHTISPPPLSLSSTSLLIRKQDTAAAEVITPQEAVVFRNQHQYHYNPPPPQPPQPPQPPHHYVAQQQPVLSYTEQLKSMLQQQQQNSGFNSSSSTNKVAPVCEEPHSAGNAWNASVMAPISVSTQIMTKSVNIETQQTNSGNRAVNSSASFENMREKSREKLQQVPTALNQQQHQQQQTTTTKSTSLGLATQQQQQQHQQQSQPTVSFNLTPTHHQQQQTILATYNLIAAENVYDLPTPPTTSNSVVELLPPPPPAPEQSTAIECTPLVKPSSHSQFINQRISRSNSTGSQQCSPPQVAPPAPPPPPVPPKPHFKRLNSIGDGDQQTIEQKIMAARKKSLEMNNSASSGSNPLLINELSTILARQKKKIEESMNTNGANTEVNRSASNEPQLASRSSTRVGSPTLTKKPPPPPRSDRSQLNRRPSTDSRI